MNLDECGVDPERARSQLRRDERARLVEALARRTNGWMPRLGTFMECTGSFLRDHGEMRVRG